MAEDRDDDELELRRAEARWQGFFEEAARGERRQLRAVSSFFTTEDAVRRAFAEAVPRRLDRLR